jgi:hypothetical protein
MQEPVLEKTLDLPFDYTLTFRATPRTITRTVIRLLPWAVVAMLPSGKRPARMATAIASRISPLARYSVK